MGEGAVSVKYSSSMELKAVVLVMFLEVAFGVEVKLVISGIGGMVLDSCCISIILEV